MSKWKKLSDHEEITNLKRGSVVRLISPQSIGREHTWLIESFIAHGVAVAVTTALVTDTQEWEVLDEEGTLPTIPCNGWVRFSAVDTMHPNNALLLISKWDVQRNNAKVIASYYKEIPTSENWIFVTDNGSYYRHNAKYVVWTGQYSIVRWSDQSLEEVLEALMLGHPIPDDLDYET